MEHMKKASAAQVDPPCRFCGGAACPCGQKGAAVAVRVAAALPLPAGNHHATVAKGDFLRSIPRTDRLTRQQMLGLARAADSLADFWSLGGNAAAVLACTSAAKLARDAAEQMP